MRIGIDISTLCENWDGIGSYVLKELKYLDSLSDDNIYFLYSFKPLVKKFEFNERFHFIIDDEKIHLVWLLTTLPARMKEDDLDIFWQPNFLCPKKWNKTRLIVTIHDLAGYSHLQYASIKTIISQKLFLKRTCRIASKILAISNDCKQEIVNTLSVPDNKIVTIYNSGRTFEEGMSATNEEVKECLKKYGLCAGEYILFVGTLSPRKNDVVMIKAYIDYRKSGGKKKLLLAGKLANESKKAKKLIDISQFRDDIILSGYVSELDKRIFYYNAAMLLYPSRLEGFGLPLLEGMKAGIPVITSNVSCMPEIATNAAVYLNNIDDPRELSSCIFKVESFSAAEKNKLISAGKQRVEFFGKQEFEKHTYEAIINA